MRPVLRRVLATGVALAITGAVVAFSALPVPVQDHDRAVIRLSWRLRGEQVGVADCRRPTPEELARLPAHMRNPDACMGELAPYRLKVELNGRLVADDLLEGSGARHDRPIYVFRELRLEPGEHRLRVSFTRDGEGGVPEEGALDLGLERTVRLEEGHVALVTFDAEARTLILTRRTPGAGR